MNLVERAKQLAPEFAATAADDAKLRRLSDTTWTSLKNGGFLRALQPARWGGGEVHIVEFIDAIVEISRASPSAGWVAGVIGVHPWQLALFADAAQHDMWGTDPTTMHSSSYNPTGKAEKVDGGYRVSGRWSFSSGCDHCQGVNLGAIAGMLRTRWRHRAGLSLVPAVARPVPDRRQLARRRSERYRQQRHRRRRRVRARPPHAVARRLHDEFSVAGPRT